MTEPEYGSSGAFNAGPGSEWFGPDSSAEAGSSGSELVADGGASPSSAPSPSPAQPAGSTPDPYALPAGNGQPAGYRPPPYAPPPAYGQPVGYGQPSYPSPPAYAPPPTYGPPAYGPPGYGQPGGYPYGYGMSVKQRTNGLAIASLVLGIVWVYWIGSILALVFGYVSLSQIKKRGDSGHGMAIAGVVLGWIGVATLIGFFVLVVAVGSHNDFSSTY